MALVKPVEVRSLDSFKGGMAEFFTPQASHETMLVQVPAGAQDDLFVHRYQTDQLLVVRGSMVLVVLQNRQYRYIPLIEAHPQVVHIPPGYPTAQSIRAITIVSWSTLYSAMAPPTKKITNR